MIAILVVLYIHFVSVGNIFPAKNFAQITINLIYQTQWMQLVLYQEIGSVLHENLFACKDVEKQSVLLVFQTTEISNNNKHIPIYFVWLKGRILIFFLIENKFDNEKQHLWIIQTTDSKHVTWGQCTTELI